MYKTDCSTCVFFDCISDHKCLLGKRDIYQVRGKVEGANLNAFCSAYRPEQWAEEIGDHSIDDLIYQVRKEMSPPINFTINFNGSLVDLEKTLKSIREIKNRNIRSTLTVISRQVEYTHELLDIINKQPFIKDRIFLVHMISDDVIAIDQAFKNMVNGYVVAVECGYVFRDDFSKRLEHYVCDKIEDVYMVYDDNHILFYSKIFKVLGGNRDKQIGDKLFTGRFVDKVLSMDESKKGIYNWGEFFE